jgi:hypothetical protein
MIRNSLSSSSANAFMVVSAAKGLQFQYRASSGATSAAVAGALAGAPEWVRIVRAGNTITGYSSANGDARRQRDDRDGRDRLHRARRHQPRQHARRDRVD